MDLKRTHSARKKKSVPPSSEKNQLMADYARAFTSTCIAICATFPMDTIKVRVQAGTHSLSSQGFLAIGRSMYAKEGIGSLYRGIRFPIFARGPSHSLVLSSKEFAHRRVLEHDPKASALRQGTISGIFGAFCSLPIHIPQELLKS